MMRHWAEVGTGFPGVRLEFNTCPLHHVVTAPSVRVQENWKVPDPGQMGKAPEGYLGLRWKVEVVRQRTLREEEGRTAAHPYQHPTLR